MRTILNASLIVFTAAGAFGQPGDAPPAFEVASIRVSPTGKSGGEGSRRENIQVSPGTLTMRNVSLKSCIRWAYHVTEFQVSGPDWLGFDRYDVVAKAAGPATDDQLRPMLQTLLAERFKLALHRQTKELQAYLLQIGKNGPKFHESKTEGETNIQPQQQKMSVTVERAPVSQLVDMLSNVLRAPVIDMTGLTGRYDITINVAKYIADMQPGGPPPDLVALITGALQEELGLKVEPKKTAVDLLIVDHVEKTPVEN